MAAARGGFRLVTGGRGLSSPARRLGDDPSRLSPRQEAEEQVPHRRHPGISNLKTIRLPDALSQGVRLLLEQSPIRRLEDGARELSDFLWSRKRAVEDRELRARAQRLWERLAGSAERTRTEEGSGAQGDQRKEERLQERVLAELRRTTYRWKPISYDEQLSKVYMAARLDGGYAAVTRVLHEIKKRVPEFQPRTLLDFGSGTGTVTWASRQAWGGSLREYLCVDSSAAMHQTAEFLMRGGSDADTEQVSGVYFRHFLPVSPKVKFDVAVSAYSLSELPTLAERLHVVETLWRKTESFLVLIENGTKEGHQILMEARDVVLKTKDKDPGARVYAPCPHDLTCPKLLGKTPLPCNFTQAYQPLPFTWNASVKSEKFSYVVLRRGPREEEEEEESERWPRIVQPILCRPRHVHVHLCCADGALRHAVLSPRKSGRDLYRQARCSDWGDRLPADGIAGRGEPSAPGEESTARWPGDSPEER
ncbi:methyltransferase-like protein 17, mitochondrial isoform X2 [Carcharodon carcharias]|uniref:methyltransferase-like protein 17, mitochondrial isoform X2 n=1 Tax=Carcharodon carcharias TaxID=13397 RepID=UPI001B7F7102|nr:methyltransferase-like protein 17, mitochondrial isoform X2 [Carcharodon carcharias]